MKFGPTSTSKALGTVLAHSIGGLKKGSMLGVEQIAQLEAQDIATVTVATLSDRDVGENEAAEQIAKAISGPDCLAYPSFTGRANVHAGKAGLVLVNEPMLLKANSVHEALTIACLKTHELVSQGQMLTTVKIITFGVPRSAFRKVLNILSKGKLVTVAPLQPLSFGLVITKTKSTKLSLITKSEKAIAERLTRLGSVLGRVMICDHEKNSIAVVIKEIKAAGHAPILIFGASAISDRADIVPSGLRKAGGRIVRLGMPVDPGNLLLLGELAKTPVIGVPTCARSPKLNGFDWVLNRLCAGLTIKAQDLTTMAVGGLLTEIQSRPQPRESKKLGQG